MQIKLVRILEHLLAHANGLCFIVVTAVRTCCFSNKPWLKCCPKLSALQTSHSEQPLVLLKYFHELYCMENTSDHVVNQLELTYFEVKCQPMMK